MENKYFDGLIDMLGVNSGYEDKTLGNEIYMALSLEERIEFHKYWNRKFNYTGPDLLLMRWEDYLKKGIKG